jgi:hypothetical protein
VSFFDETDYAEVEETYDDESPAHVNRQEVEVPSQRHLDLYRLLCATASPDTRGRLTSWWPQLALATKLQVSVRTLRNLLADLREPGLDPRHPRGTPPGLRLGLIRVEGTSYRDKATGRHRLGGNDYVIVAGLQAILASSTQATPQQSKAPAQVNRQRESSPVVARRRDTSDAEEDGRGESPAQVNRQEEPTPDPENREQATISEPVPAAQVNRQEAHVACLNKGKAPVRGEVGGVLQPVPPTGVLVREVEPEGATPFDDLDPDSDLAAFVDVVAMLKAAGLEAASVEVYENDDPRLRPRRPAKRWPDPRRSYRGRALTGSLDDFRDGLELLERDTCASEADRCVPGRGGQRCRRHTRRSERGRPAS